MIYKELDSKGVTQTLKWALMQENLSSGVCKQQRRRLISAFVIPLLESISKLATSKFSSFKLVSVAEETGVSLAMMEAPKTGFVASRCKY